MLNFIDISSHQADLNLVAVSNSIQGVIVKATEGTSYVNPYCDRHYQQAKNANIMRGFYHSPAEATLLPKRNSSTATYWVTCMTASQCLTGRECIKTESWYSSNPLSG